MTRTPSGATGPVARTRLAARLGRALEGAENLPLPTYVVDLDTFDANAADLVRRAAGKPVRVASKSLRVPALLERALGTAGFAGVLGYSLREALWLVEQGVSDDVLLGYPTADVDALRRLVRDERACAAVTLMVDDTSQLDLLDAVRGQVRLRVVIDVDAGLQLPRGIVGPKRSPLRTPEQVAELAREVLRRGLQLAGVMTYEGQVAGVPDDVPGQRARSAVVRRLKAASVRQLGERRAAVAAALDEVAPVPLWNAGGSGSLETSAADPVVTEVTAGSGLLVPGLFDHYRAFAPRPAAFFGLPVVRRPAPGTVTVAGGGLVASGPAGDDRLPLPWAPPGLRLTGLEGAGEVQTPLTGPGADRLRVGDLVWFRHAKAGEVAEHVSTCLLVSGDRVVDRVPTYRGAGSTW